LLSTKMMNDVHLTAHEQEQARQQALKALRQRLEQNRPDPAQYQSENSRAAHLLTQILVWSKATIPVIALLAALASSVRTVQTAAEIYSASGSHPLGVVLAALAFTLAVEGSLFTVALAQEGERLKRQASGAPRQVWSLRQVWHGIQVRIGIRDPLNHDEVTGGGLWVVMALAIFFAVAANAYMGLRPLLAEMEATSLQDLFRELWQAPGTLQLTFIVDMAGILFPPFMALAAGHLTARFAAEVAAAGQGAQQAYERDLAAWRDHYNDPLTSEEGQRLWQRYMEDKRQAKAARQARKQQTAADFLAKEA